MRQVGPSPDSIYAPLPRVKKTWHKVTGKNGQIGLIKEKGRSSSQSFPIIDKPREIQVGNTRVPIRYRAKGYFIDESLKKVYCYDLGHRSIIDISKTQEASGVRMRLEYILNLNLRSPFRSKS